jgi:tetratricopeptide (TPR) repeat protein
VSTPKRPRTARIEDVNQRRFEEALGEFFVFREFRRDIGVDGQVEIFDGDDTTGLTFDVQLRATDARDERRARRVRLRHGQVEYWRSRAGPTLIVRYLGASDELYARWLHSYDRYFDGEPTANSIPLPMRDDDLLDEARRSRLRAEVEAFHALRSAALALPLRMRCAVVGAMITDVELLLALLAENRTPDVLVVDAEPGEAGDLRLVVAADHVSVDLAGVTGAAIHMPTAEVAAEDLARELLALCAIAFAMVGQSFLAGRMARVYLPDSMVSEDGESVLVLASAMAQARQVREALELADLLDERDEVADNSASLMLVPLVHARALSDEEAELRISMMRSRVRRRVAAGSRRGAAAELVSLANAQRHLGQHGRALAALQKALRLDPGYEQRAHYFEERGAANFFAGQYREAATDYQRALELGAGRFTGALAADASLFAGRYSEAHRLLTVYLADEDDEVAAAEYRLKKELCDELVTRRGLDRQLRHPDRADELADRAAKAEGPLQSKVFAEKALGEDALCALAWFNLAVSLRELEAPLDEIGRAWRFAAITMEWDPTVWTEALLSPQDDELVLPLLLTARRLTDGAVFQTLASLAREREAPEMLERLPELIAALPAEREEFVTVRAIDVRGVEHVRIPSRTSPATTQGGGESRGEL